MVAGGQKWMRAGWGSGVMAVSERALDRLAPTLSGWLGVEDAMDTDRPGAPPGAGDGRPVPGGDAAHRRGIPVGRGHRGDRVGRDRCHQSPTIAERVGATSRMSSGRAGAEVRTPWTHPGERAGILCFRMPGAGPGHAEPSRRGRIWWCRCGAPGYGSPRTPRRRRRWSGCSLLPRRG